MNKKIIAITMGDASGIGPELILKISNHRELFKENNIIVLGETDILNFYGRLLNVKSNLNTVKDIREIQENRLNILDFNLITNQELKIGKVCPISGNAAVQYTLKAASMAMNKEIDAMVSAPLNKESMRQAGYHYEGQTQILGEVANSSNYGMILILGDLKIMMLSTHISLKEACSAVTINNVYKKIELSYKSLKFLGIKNPKIGVSALNPHCGENGLFGDEEINAIIPAVKKARENNINAIGPIPGDIIFYKANKNKEYDIVLAMFHDQANMAAKLLGFGEVVTLVAGIPFIRTSVGHGTAFDIAGKGMANEKNFYEAIKSASFFVNLRRKKINEKI